MLSVTDPEFVNLLLDSSWFCSDWLLKELGQGLLCILSPATSARQVLIVFLQRQKINMKISFKAGISHLNQDAFCYIIHFLCLLKHFHFKLELKLLFYHNIFILENLAVSTNSQPNNTFLHPDRTGNPMYKKSVCV